MGEKILEVEREGEEVVIRFRQHLVPGMPESARLHMMAAGKEMLLAFRNLIDVAVEYSEVKEKQRASRQRTKVDIS